MTPAVIRSLSDGEYLRELRVLGAWWSLGSSTLEPAVLLWCAPTRLPEARL